MFVSCPYLLLLLVFHTIIKLLLLSAFPQHTTKWTTKESVTQTITRKKLTKTRGENKIKRKLTSQAQPTTVSKKGKKLKSKSKYIWNGKRRRNWTELSWTKKSEIEIKMKLKYFSNISLPYFLLRSTTTNENKKWNDKYFL